MPFKPEMVQGCFSEYMYYSGIMFANCFSDRDT